MQASSGQPPLYVDAGDTSVTWAGILLNCGAWFV
jgi:hypothetical protein